MRRVTAAVLMLLLCLLSACGGKENQELQPPMDFRAALQQAGGCSFTAEVTADYQERVYTFTLKSLCRTDGTAELTVTAPETIAGISAKLTQEGGQLTFDDMALDFGELASGLTSPLAVPVLCASCWAGEYIVAAGEQDGSLRVSYEKGYDEQGLQMDTWFETKNNTPIFAEVCYNNTVVVKMTVTDFQFASGG